MTTTAVSHQPSWGYYATSKESWGELGDPRAGPYGVNSGVLLVNLTRARQVRHLGTRCLRGGIHLSQPSPHLFFAHMGRST